MMDPAQFLKDLKPTKDFFVGVDSDGCIFDSMEIKHKECFCPPFINHFGLQSAAKYARQVWEFVNLYSTTRGCNRFHAIITAMDVLAKRPEVIARGADIPKLAGVRSWVERETRLGNPALEAEVSRTNDPDLALALAWSLDVNESVKKIVRNVPPFPRVRESLSILKERADIMVVSQTPTEALEREWREHGLDSFVRTIAGQEMGTKAEHITLGAGGKYGQHKVLMIGDAPGDLKAARSSGALFFPINPGREEASWELLHGEALNRFFDGTYAGAYEAKLVDEFNRLLPERPSW